MDFLKKVHETIEKGGKVICLREYISGSITFKFVVVQLNELCEVRNLAKI